MRAPPRNPIFTAFVAGQAAGLVMLAVAIMLAVAMGKSLAFPLQMMTALMVGPDALQEVTLDTIVPGLLAHQVGPTLLWSKAFGLMVAFKSEPWRLLHAMLVGATTGTLALLTDVYLFMPRIQHQLHARDLWSEHMTEMGSWATHLAFGLALGCFYWWWQDTEAA